MKAGKLWQNFNFKANDLQKVIEEIKLIHVNKF